MPSATILSQLEMQSFTDECAVRLCEESKTYLLISVLPCVSKALLVFGLCVLNSSSSEDVCLTATMSASKELSVIPL